GSLAPTCNSWDGQTITLAILKPDGTTLASTTSTLCGNHVNAQLPTAGTYAVYVDVANARTGTLTVTLSQPVSGAITPIDDPLVVTLRPGQGIRKTFTGNAGDWISFAVSSVSS